MKISLAVILLFSAIVSAYDPAAHGTLSWVPVTTLPHYRSPQAYENDLAWDYKNGVIILGFGHNSANTNRVWEYTFKKDTFTNSNPFHRPPKTCGPALVYDPGMERIFKMGGAFHPGLNHGYGEISADGKQIKAMITTEESGVWAYDAARSQWYSMRPIQPWPKSPSYPYAPGFSLNFTYARDFGLNILTGRLNNNAVWAYHGHTNRWIQFPVGTVIPTAMYQAPTTAYDLKNHVLIKVGGTVGAPDIMEDSSTWSFDIASATWKSYSLSKNTPIRKGTWSYGGMTATYDEWLRKTIVVSGDGAVTAAFDPATDADGWNTLSLTGVPAAGGNMGRHFRSSPYHNVHLLYAAALLSPDNRHPVYALKITDKLPMEPFPPESVTVLTNASGLTISWIPSDTGTPADSFYIFRSKWNGRPGAYVKVGSTAAHTWNDAPAVDNGDMSFYSYYVTARKDSLQSLASCPVYSNPVRPEGLVATVWGEKEVSLRWKRIKGTDIVGYNVYRAKGGYPSGKNGFTKLTADPIDNAQFADVSVDLSDRIICHYAVTAVNRLGQESGYSPLAHTVPEAPGGPWMTGAANTMAWLAPATGNVSSYQICDNGYRAESSGDTNKIIATLGATARSYVYDKTFTGDRGYVVRAVNVLGQYGFCSDFIPIGGVNSALANSYYEFDGRTASVAADTFWPDMSIPVQNENNTQKAGIASFTLAASPNPFCGSVNIRFTIPEKSEGETSLRIYDVKGREIFRNSNLKGINEISWTGAGQPAGLYIVKMSTGIRELSTRISLIR
ncbi:MAG: T9SS type A sorting domain-containing protein [Fibrobacteres bacterium]|nr:T9SS type A sorting domain-containing protein [Fibrobacterota bacterium]